MKSMALLPTLLSSKRILGEVKDLDLSLLRPVTPAPKVKPFVAFGGCRIHVDFNMIAKESFFAKHGDIS